MHYKLFSRHYFYLVIIFFPMYYKKSVENSSKFDKNDENKTRQSNNFKKKNQHNNEDFMIHGQWMQGKKHNQTCSFIDKEKCCKKNQNLHLSLTTLD